MAVLREQVKRVLLWARCHNAASPFESKRITVRPCDILLTEANVAVLKAAGEQMERGESPRSEAQDRKGVSK